MGTIQRKRIAFFTGIILIIFGIALNKYTIGMLFREHPRPVTGALNLLIIYSFEVVAAGVGLFFIIKRKELTLQKLFKYYVTIAYGIFTAFLVFLIINAALYSLDIIKASRGSKSNPITEKYNIPLESIYPNLAPKDISQLLSETWSRGLVYAPFTEFKEKSFLGTYVKIHEAGFRYVEDQAPWPPPQDALIVFVFGGSTTFGYGVADKDTIPSQLQKLLRESFPQQTIAVYNFGASWYYSSQERVLFERLLIENHWPDIALFIDGVNDSLIINDEPALTKEVAKLFNDKTRLAFVDQLPLVRFIRSYTQQEKTDGEAWSDATDAQRKDMVNQIIRVYALNKKIIEGTTRAFGVKSYFIWQPAPSYDYNPLDYPFAVEGAQPGYSYVYPAMDDYRQRNRLGDNFLWLGNMQKNIKKGGLYVDGIHYSPEMSGMIAKEISDFLGQKLRTQE